MVSEAIDRACVAMSHLLPGEVRSQTRQSLKF
jgi:hypothetical protein